MTPVAATRSVDPRVYVLPTRFGVVFLAVLAGMLLGAVNHNNNFALLMTFLLSGMLLVSIIRTHQNIARLQVTGARAEPVFSGETAVFECRVVNPGPTRNAVSLAIHDPSGGPPVDLPSDSVTRVPVAVTTVQRGWFRADHLVFSSRYPFGLFRSWRRFSLNAAVLVYPAPIDGALATDPAPRSTGADSGPESDFGSAGGSVDFTGLSPYTPGDPLRRISWKAYARGQGLMVKTFSDPPTSTVMIDWHAIRSTDTERKLGRLCDMVLKADRLGVPYGLRIPGSHVGPAIGPAHRGHCLEALARFGLTEESA